MLSIQLVVDPTVVDIAGRLTGDGVTSLEQAAEGDFGTVMLENVNRLETATTKQPSPAGE